MSTNLIGIGGKLRSGKDTVADYLVEKEGWVKLNMSSPLHEALNTLDPLIPITFKYGTGHWRYSSLVEKQGYTAAKENPEVRRLLQMLGTEVGRKMFSESVWVDLAAQKIDKILEEGQSVVITGIRFPNEFTMITERGGLALWVERPDLETAQSHATHASEVGISSDDFQEILYNDGTLEELYEKVRQELLR